MTYLDTHVLVWLHAGETKRLSPAAKEAIETGDLLVSPAAVLELQFLKDIGRIAPEASRLVGDLSSAIGVRVCRLPFSTVVDHTLGKLWTRDPFDRLIVANAEANGAQLVTKDETILQNYKHALW
jgi:PIN domain nuclease of toxin-antitoxin system